MKTQHLLIIGGALVVLYLVTRKPTTYTNPVTGFQYPAGYVPPENTTSQAISTIGTVATAWLNSLSAVGSPQPGDPSFVGPVQ